MNNQKKLLCAFLVASCCLPMQALQAQQAKQGAFRIAGDIVAIPVESIASDNAVPLGLSVGGTYYFNDNVALNGALGFGLMDDTIRSLGSETDIGLDPYFRGNVQFGSFSNPDHTLYGLIGIEPYTFTFDGESADDSVGDIGFGIGASMGNGRMGGAMGIEFMIVQDSDLDDDIKRISIYGEF